MRSPLRSAAHAKVNLALRVLGKRADGFHRLWTIFDQLELHDDLAWQPQPSAPFTLEVRAESDDARVGCGPDNLVLRAARAFCERFACPLGGSFLLTKRIPAGGGLGGGSSDAAAALRLLAREHGVDAEGSALRAVARALGSDVPFFLRGGRAWAGGRGDEIHPIEAGPRLHYVLLWPGYGCETRNVYARWHRELTDKPRAIDSATLVRLPGTLAQVELDEGAARRFLQNLRPERSSGGHVQGLFNDLDAAAAVACPRLGRLRARLHQEGFFVHLSGSGSTVFVAGFSPRPMQAIAEALSRTLARLHQAGFEGVAAGARVMQTRSRR